MALRSASFVKAVSTALATTQRTLATTAVVDKGKMMGDPFEHATGPEKFELAAMREGNDDPFFMKAVKRGKGTRDEPNIVNAMDSFRVVGCICNENEHHIKWMWLYEDKPKRCYCGHWFKLKVHPAPERFKLPV